MIPIGLLEIGAKAGTELLSIATLNVALNLAILNVAGERSKRTAGPTSADGPITDAIFAADTRTGETVLDKIVSEETDSEEIDETVSELSLSHLPSDEQHAITAALDGDLEAFNVLVVKYQRMAYSVAYRMMQRADEAEDVVQESFIKAYRALETFRGGQFKSWLMRIVVNSSYDALRVRKRYVSESIEEEPTEDGPATALIDNAESPQDFVERMELGAHIEMGIQSLPEDQRVALMLCDIHGYAYDEIAEIIGQPIGTVKSRINRARGKLRDYLIQQPELLPSPLRPKNT